MGARSWKYNTKVNVKEQSLHKGYVTIQRFHQVAFVPVPLIGTKVLRDVIEHSKTFIYVGLNIALERYNKVYINSGLWQYQYCNRPLHTKKQHKKKTTW